MTAGKTLVAMSGGVDSSVAALLMRDGGFNCAAVMLILSENCDKDVDFEDARNVAKQLRMPFESLDFRDFFP